MKAHHINTSTQQSPQQVLKKSIQSSFLKEVYLLPEFGDRSTFIFEDMKIWRSHVIT